jgi:hypothetical protein
MFRLEDKARGRCLSFGMDGFEGMHTGYGTPLHRRIEFQARNIRILDMGLVTEKSEAKRVTVKDAKSLRELWNLDLSFSPGYGQQD